MTAINTPRVNEWTGKPLYGNGALVYCFYRFGKDNKGTNIFINASSGNIVLSNCNFKEKVYSNIGSLVNELKELGIKEPPHLKEIYAEFVKLSGIFKEDEIIFNNLLENKTLQLQRNYQFA